MLTAWQQRSEPVGFFVGEAIAPVLHRVAGDKAHRFTARNHTEPLMIPVDVHVSMRVPVSLLALGRRVGMYVQEIDDISHVVRRMLAHGSAHVAPLEAAIWDGEVWTVDRVDTLV